MELTGKRLKLPIPDWMKRGCCADWMAQQENQMTTETCGGKLDRRKTDEAISDEAVSDEAESMCRR